MEHKSKTAHLAVPVLAGVGVSFVVMLLGCFLAAWLIHRGTVDIDDIGYLVMGILFLTGMAGGITAIAKGNKNILIIGVIVSVAVFLAILCVGILFFDGTISGAGQTLLLVTGATISAVLVGTHRKDKRKPRHRRRRTG